MKSILIILPLLVALASVSSRLTRRSIGILKSAGKQLVRLQAMRELKREKKGCQKKKEGKKKERSMLRRQPDAPPSEFWSPPAALHRYHHNIHLV
jgi:hypothetical protein